MGRRRLPEEGPGTSKRVGRRRAGDDHRGEEPKKKQAEIGEFRAVLELLFGSRTHVGSHTVASVVAADPNGHASGKTRCGRVWYLTSFCGVAALQRAADSFKFYET